MPVYNMHEAKTNLSRLLESALLGEEIILARGGKPLARIVPLGREQAGQRDLGAMAESVRIADDFDAPLPEDVLADFEGAGEGAGEAGPV